MPGWALQSSVPMLVPESEPEADAEPGFGRPARPDRARLRVRIWDLPTRLFHAALALAVVAALVSAWLGGNAMVWHLRAGLTVLALLVFRLVWGLLGGHWSRFASFWPNPRSTWRYLRQPDPAAVPVAGHNPLGSWSVWAMLLVLALQVATGLVADDEIATRGPLAAAVSTARSLQATGWHHGAGPWFVLALLALHVAAIVHIRLRRGVDLVGPMLHGDRLFDAGTVPPRASRDHAGTRLLAAVLALGAAALALWVGRQGG